MAGEALVNRYVETFNQRDVARWAALFDPDAVARDPLYPEPIKGRAGLENSVTSVWRAFPDIRWRLQAPVIESGDHIAFVLAVNGVNDGPLAMPDGELPATGKAVAFETALFWTVGPDGLINDQRGYFDATGVTAQLGLTA